MVGDCISAGLVLNLGLTQTPALPLMNSNFTVPSSNYIPPHPSTEP